MSGAGVGSVGFIGLGNQGGPMAHRIVEAGFPTTLWARRRVTTAPFADTKAVVAASPAELGAACDLVCVCVVDDAGVSEVITGPDGLLEGMRPGGVIAVHSTVHPDTCRRLAEQAAERHITLLDAPVSGGGPAAQERRLLVMVGGETEAVERVRPVFETYGDPVVHLGPVGAGQRAKLVNNLLLAANIGVAESAYELARGLDIEPRQLGRVLAHGSGASFAAKLLADMGCSVVPLGDHTGRLLQKDARLVADLARAADLKAGTVLQAADAALVSMGHPR
ncbi:NAD(P)-dependent oxidoreductase [Streptomyces sp. NPDC057363]|uniref:NAD(P)-dependent oxidoreductase n=1 Tax=Streptomyces sp. NPDC057363 TaxID=3346107 RepID=UPI003642022D